MLHNNQQYETYYGIGLLDDMHNYFPDLLYNTGRFQNVQDVLTYIRNITRYRFDRFSAAEEARSAWQTDATQPQNRQQYNRRRWRTAQTQAPRQQRQQRQTQTPLRTDNYRTRFPTLNTPVNQPTTTYFPLYQLPPLNTFTDTIPTESLVRDRVNITTIPFDFTVPLPALTPTTDIDNATALLTLIGLLGAPTTQLLEPVIVAASNEHINRATQIETITEEPVPPGICVICQENFSVSNTLRTIEYCSHIFHNDCILRHFQTSVRCPTCRFDIRDSE